MRASRWLPSPRELRSLFNQLSPGHCLQQVVVAETLDAFVSLSTEDLREQATEWAELTACHVVFQAQFLIALKVRYNLQAGDGSNAVTPRKRRRLPTPQPAAKPTSSPTAIDLTDTTTSVVKLQ